MYYGKLLRQMADSLRGLSDDLKGDMEKVIGKIEQYRESAHRHEKSNKEQENIERLRAEKIFAEHQESERDKSARDDRNHATQKSIKRAAWLTFAAAALYGTVAAFQWWDLRQNFISDERGYIQMVTPTFVKGHTLTDSSPLEINFVFLSAGKTPTRQVETYGCIIKYPWKRPVTQKEIDNVNAFLDTAFEVGKGQLSVLRPTDHAPGSTFLATFQINDRCQAYEMGSYGLSLTPSELVDFTNGNLTLVLIVGAVYSDDFGAKHESEACQFVPPDSKEGWDYCPSHNTL